MAYTTEIVSAQGIDFSGRVSLVSGVRGRLLWDGSEVDQTGGYYGSRAKSQARLAVENMRRRYEHHLRTTGRRMEVDRREKRAQLQAAKEASTARRKDFMRDRIAMFRILERFAAVEQTNADYDTARVFVERHRQAVADIEADPQNERGGAAKEG